MEAFVAKVPEWLELIAPTMFWGSARSSLKLYPSPVSAVIHFADKQAPGAHRRLPSSIFGWLPSQLDSFVSWSGC